MSYLEVGRYAYLESGYGAGCAGVSAMRGRIDRHRPWVE